ncbi:hypothetical protein L228DRAFT_271306 [Xylona heveae TC161]|uniref:Hydrophobin n=1 Tax=Xylona heveae (strain CBS 132557 / TC161) TaxID=1328760 RepID=A0A164ZTW2_XYLHT|nr:hypothetical protein L228DRAFT_271306 [Xylona heveae TC161]KZF19510.1 hypothetical protein L228DRAFT_271306 [Xylona heveae TC161]
MQFKTLALALPALFTLAAAVPSPNGGSGPTVGDASCGNGQVLSCCNTDSESSGGLIGGILDGVLGGSCTALNIPVVGINIPLSQACGSNQAACCTGDSNGLVNVACTNVNL